METPPPTTTTEKKTYLARIVFFVRWVLNYIEIVLFFALLLCSYFFQVKKILQNSMRNRQKYMKEKPMQWKVKTLKLDNLPNDRPMNVCWVYIYDFFFWQMMIAFRMKNIHKSIRISYIHLTLFEWRKEIEKSKIKPKITMIQHI